MFTAPGSSRTSWSCSVQWDGTFHSYLWDTHRNTFLKPRLTTLITDTVLSFAISVVPLRRSLIIRLIDATRFSSNPSDFVLGAGTEH